MPASSLAVQMYTLRAHTKTPADIAKSLSRVKKMGYDAIQRSAFGPIDAKEFAKMLKEEGLACVATHVSMDQMENETQTVIDEHKLWGCAYTAIGGFNSKETSSAATWNDFVKRYNLVAKKFEGSGVQIGYHNHSHELVHFDGKPALQILIDGLDPRIWMEIDTYWITHGGGDPAQWIRKVKGRIPCIHLKDMAINSDRKQLMAEIGEGNLNWPEVFKACKEAGVRWYIIEQDDTNGRDPFESLEISLKNLRAMGMN